jgi:hypothetical protein
MVTALCAQSLLSRFFLADYLTHKAKEENCRDISKMPLEKQLGKQ